MGEAVEAFLGAAAQRFRVYAERLAQSFGHVVRHELLRGCLIGLMLPSGRKSVEPMAALLSMLPAAREAAKRRGFSWRVCESLAPSMQNCDVNSTTRENPSERFLAPLISTSQTSISSQ